MNIVIKPSEETAFFEAVDEASKKAVWCAVATIQDKQPRVRIVHPCWAGQTLWFATGPTSPKAKQIAKNPWVDIQYQVAPPDFVHVMVRGKAELVRDDVGKKLGWDAIDYDLTAFGAKGWEDPNFCPVRITPTRIELSEMFGSQNKRLWRA